MYEEENNHPIFQHTKKENTLSSSDYHKYAYGYQCEEDVEVYRGLCFRTKSSFEAFKKRLDNGEYFPSIPESFTRNKGTALDFAKQKKTFFGFLDDKLFIENEYRKVTEESISGYAGIIIKCVIPKGEGLDISKSEYAVEDEIVYMTNKPIKLEYEIIEGFENQLKNNPIDINKHLQTNSIDEPLSKYIIANHADEIDKQTQHKLLDEILTPYKINREDRGFFLVDEEKDLVLGQERHTDFNMDKKEISISARPIFHYYKKGVFSDPSSIERIEEYCHHVINATCEFIELEHLYGDEDNEIYYNSRNISDLNFFANDFTKERYQNAVHLSRPKSYDQLNDSIKDLNFREDLSEMDKRKEADKIANEIKDFILEKVDMMAKDKNKMQEEIDKQSQRVKKAKREGSNLKNR